jgi:phospholipid/cholesterol/gamma-HCH transport system substrate-binding protein
MDESKLELKLGLLFVAALGAVLALFYLMGELTFRSAAQVSVDFSHTGNVVRNAPVKLGGVSVGHVKAIFLEPARREASNQPLPVRMVLDISNEAAASLRADAAVMVSSQGPLGEAYLELWPGHSEATYDASRPLRGVDAPRIDLVSFRLSKFLEAASQALESDPGALSKLVRGVGGLAVNLDATLTGNQAELASLLRELGSAAKDLSALARLSRAQLEPGGRLASAIDDVAQSAKIARAELPEVAKKASSALGGLAAVTSPLTEEDGQHLKGTLERANAATERLASLSARADVLLSRIEAGDGTLGAFVTDKQAYDDLKSLLADLRKHPWKMLWKD